MSDRIISKNDDSLARRPAPAPHLQQTYTSSCNLDISLRFEAVAAASASEELVRALNKGYKSFQWPRYKPVTRQPSLSLKMTAPHQHASINQMHPESCSTTIPTWAWAVEPRMREKIKWSNRISPWSLAYATYCATAFAMTFRIKDANFTHF